MAVTLLKQADAGGVEQLKRALTAKHQICGEDITRQGTAETVLKAAARLVDKAEHTARTALRTKDRYPSS